MSNLSPNPNASASTNVNQSPLLDALRQSQTRYGFFPTSVAPLTVVLGISGGADSICLLHALYALRYEWKLRLHVAHLDHNLRPASAADAAWVRAQAETLGLPFHHAALEPGALAKHPDGLEAGARQARYHFLAQVAYDVTPPKQTPIIAVAHHQDDQAETILMNLIRGSGLAGLSGMGWITALLPQATGPHPRTIHVIRPMLGISRGQIRADLQRQGLTWREDATNLDTRYLRNRLRRTIIPLLLEINPRLTTTLARTAEILAGDEARLALLDRQTLAGLTHQTAPIAPLEELAATRAARRIVLDMDAFRRLDLPTRRGVLRQAVACFAVNPRAIGFEQVEALLQTLTGPTMVPGLLPGPHPLAGGLAWTHFPTHLSLHLEGELPWLPDHPHWGLPVQTTSQPRTLPIPGALDLSPHWRLEARILDATELPPGWRTAVDAWEAYLDADAATELVLTAPQPALRIAPLGMHGHTKSLGDLFTDHKIHPSLRPGWPIIQGILHDGEPAPLWVCGLTLSNHARITPTTRRVLHLAWRAIPDLVEQ